MIYRYHARDLAPLLERLLAHQDAQLADLGQTIARFDKATVEASKAFPGLGKLATGDRELRAALSEQTRLEVGRRETVLWLCECYRTPEATWELTLRDLEVLRPGTLATDDLATLKARKPEERKKWWRHG